MEAPGVARELSRSSLLELYSDRDDQACLRRKRSFLRAEVEAPGVEDIVVQQLATDSRGFARDDRDRDSETTCPKPNRNGLAGGPLARTNNPTAEQLAVAVLAMVAADQPLPVETLRALGRAVLAEVDTDALALVESPDEAHSVRRAIDVAERVLAGINTTNRIQNPAGER